MELQLNSIKKALFYISYIILVLIAFLAVFKFYPQIHPLPQQDFKITKSNLASSIFKFLPRNSNISDYTKRSQFIIDKKYYDIDSSNQQNNSKILNPYAYWEIEFWAKDGNIRSISVTSDSEQVVREYDANYGKIHISPSGRLIFMDIKEITKSDSTVSELTNQLNQAEKLDQAKEIAADYLAIILPDTSSLKYVNYTLKQDSSKEIYSINFEQKIRSNIAKYDLKIENQDVVYYNYELAEKKKTTTGSWLAENSRNIFEVIFVVMFILLIVAIFVYLIKFIRQDGISFRLSFRLLFVLIPINFAANMFELWSNSWWIIIFTGLAGTIFVAIGAVFLYSVTDSLARRVWPSKLSGMDRLVHGNILHKNNATNMLHGIALGIISAAIFSLTLYVFVHYFDVQLQIYEKIEYSAVLFFTTFAIAIKALNNGFFSEYFFRFFGITVIHRWVKNTILLTVLGAIISIYLPDEIIPENIFIRITTLFIPAIIFTIYFLRFDIITTITGYFTFQLIKFASVFYSTPDPYFQNISFSLLLILGILFLIVLATLWFKRNTKDSNEVFIPEYIKKQEEKQRFMRELEIARNIQMKFLPVNTPQIENILIAASCQPAWEVGGDYFDYFDMPDGKIGIAIGDVSNKGVSAAFFMTLVKGFLKALCRNHSAAADILIQANKLFFENVERGHFISMIFGILDPLNGTFRFARAGHNPLLLVIGSDAKTEWKTPPGIGIGLTGGQSFEKQIREENIHLKKDDIIVLYTDGFSESMNPNSEEFGEERMQNLIRENKNRTPGEIIMNLEKEVEKWENGRDPIDDKTIIVIKQI